MKKSLRNILVGITTLIGSVAYRVGGTKFGTLWRDIGVPVCMIAVMTLTGHWHWTLILCAGLLYGALTTYNKWVGYLFNRPDKHTVYAESWFVTGLFYGLSMFPYAIATGEWLAFGIRCIVCAVLACLWSSLIGRAWLEEFGRGFIVLITLLIFRLSF